MAGKWIEETDEPVEQAQKPSVKAFDCPKCGGQVYVRAAGHTLSCACLHCGSLIDMSQPEYKLASSYANRVPIKLIYLPLGSRGKIAGTTWEVIGFLKRKDVSSGYTWQEYLLFNPWKGFRWLTESQGHWAFVEPVTEDISDLVNRAEFRWKGKTYRHFFRGQSEVVGVAGEFYWQVRRGERVNVSDFIAPPAMLSAEWDEGGINWSHSRALKREAVAEAFNPPKKLVLEHGLTPLSINPYSSFLKPAGFIFTLFFLALAAIHILWAVNGSGPPVFREEDLRVEQGTVFVKDSIEIGGRQGSVRIDFHSPVDNQWLEASGWLFEPKSGKTYGFTVGVEQYHGVTDGESWSEGGADNWVMLEEVPSGQYQLVMQFATDTTKLQRGQSLPAAVTLRRNPVRWLNFWLALGLAALPLGIVIYFSVDFEKRRNES